MMGFCYYSFSLFFAIFPLVHVATTTSDNNNNNNNNNSKAHLHVDYLNNQLVISPPLGGNVQVFNYTDLENVKSELHAAQEILSATSNALSSSTETLSIVLGELSVLRSIEQEQATKVTWPVLLVITQSLSPNLNKSTIFSIDGGLSIFENSNLVGVVFPILVSVLGDVSIHSNPYLNKVDFPSLQNVSGSVLISGNAPTFYVLVPLLDLMSPTVSKFNISSGSGTLACVAKRPKSCAFNPTIVLLGGSLNLTVMSYSLLNPTWSFSAVAEMPLSRANNPSVGYCSGPNALYIAAGQGTSGFLRTASKYSLDTRSWSTLQNIMSQQRTSSAGLCLNDGQTFMICGGFSATTQLSSCELLNTGLGTWSLSRSMSTTRSDHCMVLYNGYAVVFGGQNITHSFIDHVEQYNSVLNSWSSFPSLPSKVAYSAAVVVLDKIYIPGGCLTNCCPCTLPSSAVLVFDGLSWTSLVVSIPSGKRYYHAAVAFQNKLVVMGGTQAAVDVYDPMLDSWNTFPSLGSSNYQRLVSSVLYL